MSDEQQKQEPQLTARERQIALMLAIGKNNHEIAAALLISTKTVDTHRGHILKKLNVRNNVELALLSLRKGWTQLQ